MRSLASISLGMIAFALWHAGCAEIVGLRHPDADATAPEGGTDGGTSDIGVDSSLDAPPIQCTQQISPGIDLGAAVANAAGGDTVCAAAGTYPPIVLAGVQKTPRVRVVSQVRGAATSSVEFSGGSQGITIEGFTLTGARITGPSTREITIRNSVFVGPIQVDAVTERAPNILFDNNSHNNMDATTAPGARVHFSFDGYNWAEPVATIQNSVFEGGCASAIRTGVPLAIVRNQFRDLGVGTCQNAPQPDAIRFYGGPFAGTIVRENYFVNNVQVLTAYDCVDRLVIEGNVFDPGTSEPRPCQIELYSDTNSVVRHNTLLSRGNNGLICLDHKTADPAGSGTIIDNNIARAISLNNGSTAASNLNNLLVSSTPGNLSGSAIYVGGSLPSTWGGFALAVGSPGKGAGTNPTGSDIGANYFGSP